MPIKYFARIDKTQVGPLTLSELLCRGIRPSTYVWCKGMPDWQKASEVPDICRAMRRALAGLDPETGGPRTDTAEQIPATEQPRFDPTMPPRNRQEFTDYLRQAISEAEEQQKENYSIPPQGISIFMAVLATILCFPLTGLVAIWFAYKCRSDWRHSEQEGVSETQRDLLRRSAHENARLYRMMIGITFSLGIIVLGMTLSRTLF